MAQRTAAAASPPGRSRGRVPADQAVARLGQRRYAALDLGTNNCRLLIARPAADGFVVVDAFSRIVRLGEGLAASGRLSEAAMDRALDALSICADKLRRRRVSIVRSVATEACRVAANGREFVQRVYDETGIALEIISPEKEARLAMQGCHVLLEPGSGRALVFDIGGGSTELVLIETREDGEEPEVLDWYSAGWGVVSLTEAAPVDSPDPEVRKAAYRTMRTLVAQAFRPFAERVASTISADERLRLLGTSGTVTTLGSVYLGLERYDRRAIDGLMVPSEAMRAISGQLSSLSVADRAQLACIGTERADLVVAGCAILEAILDFWPAEQVGVADRGIREGILRLLMARDGHYW